MKTQENISKINNLEIKEYKNKYRLAAEEIYPNLGVNNYDNIFNCMTRFRATINDKNLVNVENIKKIPLVKGVHWNGQELQIIIGGEVTKVVDEFKKYEIELHQPAKKSVHDVKAKKTIGAKFLSFLMGVIAPAVPLLVLGGLMSAVYAFLTLPNGNNLLTTSVIDPATGNSVSIGMGNLYLFDVWSAIFFVLGKVVLSSIGIFIIFNTARHFKGNQWFALAIGLTLMCRGFFPTGAGVPFADAVFGDWTANLGKSGFLLFKLGEYPIVVGGYEGAIIPYIVGGILVTYLDKWVKSWMPTSIDTIFRGLVVYIISMFALWFALAPFAGLIEYGLIQGVTWFGNIPYGFGVAIVGLLWQPLVITGSHMAVLTPIYAGLSAQGDAHVNSAVLMAVRAAVWAQVGAAIGVMIVTKNANLKKIAWGAIPAGIFGVTEPIIYGVTLPKLRPFLLGCVGGAIAGMYSGAIGLEAVQMSAGGIFSILSMELTPKVISLTLLMWLIAIGSSILLVVLFYSERKDELSYFKKGINKLIKFTKGNKEQTHDEFKTELATIKSMKADYKKMDKYYSDISKYEQQLASIETKESKHREKMYKELTKLQEKLSKKNDETLLRKFNELNNKYSTYNLDHEKEKAQNNLNKVIETNNSLFNEFSAQKETIYNEAIQTLKTKTLDETDALVIENMMWNALNSVEIGYGIEDAKAIKFKK